MTLEEELIFAPKLDTSVGVFRLGGFKLEAEEYTLRFVLPRMTLVLLLTAAFTMAPLILWRIWLGIGMLQSMGPVGGVAELGAVSVFLGFWIWRKKSTRNILEAEAPLQRTAHLKDGFSQVRPWLIENGKAFQRLAPLEKEAYIYFLLAGIPEMLLLMYSSTPLQWSSGVAHLITLTVPLGLIFGMAGIVAGLVFWHRTGKLNLAYLVLFVLYLNFAYESGGALAIR